VEMSGWDPVKQILVRAAGSPKSVMVVYLSVRSLIAVTFVLLFVSSVPPSPLQGGPKK